MEDEYAEIQESYADFLKEVKRVIEKLLVVHKIPIAFNIYGRLKKFDSIQEKHNSKRFEIQQTITELNDLVGLRIVLLFPEYKEKVTNLLLQEFKLVGEYKKETPIVDKFGYSSTHLILEVKDEWLQTLDFKYHQNKKIEVQIRTLSEHIWAEISHSLSYKREENIPKAIQRDLYRLSALLEVVDDKLQSIKNDVVKYFQYVTTCTFEEILEMDLNPETFRRIMKECSKDNYALNDNLNRELSSKIEQNYNILTTKALYELIANVSIPEKYHDDEFIANVFGILIEDKEKRDKRQEEKEQE
jgi:ppGpp synthetase/RelA/SpoT-type nucleotidyltranferase